MLTTKPRARSPVLLLILIGSASIVSVSGDLEIHHAKRTNEDANIQVLVKAIQQDREARLDGDRPGTTTLAGTKKSHRKLAEAQEHLQPRETGKLVDSPEILVLSGGLLLLAFVIFCGGVFSCFSPPQASQDKYGRAYGTQGVHLQYAKTAPTAASSKSSLAASSKSTGSGQGQRAISGSGESPRTANSGSEDAYPSFKPLVSGQPKKDSQGPGSPGRPGMPAEKPRSTTKPPLPNPVNAQESSSPSAATKMSVKASHSPEPLSSPWDSKGAASLERIPENPETPDRGVPRSGSGGLPVKPPHPSDSAESMGSHMSRGPSGESIPFPHQLGRRHSLMIKGAANPTFSPEEEEKAAGALFQASKTMAKRIERTKTCGLGERILLKDVKLKVKDGKPVVLGEGGFGRVYLGALNKEEVAVKTILEGTRREQARFLREIKVLEQLSTAHITKFMGYSVCPEGLVLIMEYCPGGNLTHALAQSPDDGPSEFQYYNKGKQIMLEVALALEHLHSKKIAHLDIKSPNILIGKNSEAKVADCGLSRMVKGDETAMSKPGTFAWAAPEQIQGVAGTPSDIWAFGTVLWEVCTCEKPPNMRQLRPIDVPEEAPQEVVDLIAKCHESNPLKRIKAQDLHAELTACPWEQVDSESS